MRASTYYNTDEDDFDTVDFGNAALYLPGLQVLVAVLACSVTSIVACWLLPSHAVSAVRTLTLASVVGACCVQSPLRLGRAHGLELVFSALRPAVAVDLGCLILEQLTHGCASSAEVTPSWRRVVFQAAIITMVVSGFLRARNPLSHTDAPFLITLCATLLIAALPPPAVALAGPLCEPVSIFGAVERLIRAFCFACAYIVFVYASVPPTPSSGGVVVCLSRAAAASVWTLGATLPLLTLSLPQCALVILCRLRSNSEATETETREPRHHAAYKTVPTSSPVAVSDSCEPHSAHNYDAGGVWDTTAPPSPPLSALQQSNSFAPLHSTRGSSNTVHSQPASRPVFGQLLFRDVASAVHTNASGTPSKDVMAQVASRLAEDAV